MGWTVMTIVMVVFFMIAVAALYNRESERSKKFEGSLKNEVGATQKVFTCKTMTPKEMNDNLEMVLNVEGDPNYDPAFEEGEFVLRKF